MKIKYLFIGIAIVAVIITAFVFLSAKPIGQVINPQNNNANTDTLTIKVQIPCPGHAYLITNALKSLDGVQDVQFSIPNKFAATFDSSKVTKQDILNLEIFQQYSAQEI